MTGKEYLLSKKWGVFNHYLDPLQGNVNKPHNQPFGKLAWSDLVDCFDVERLAWSLHQMNAGYYFITLMQGTKSMLAPNATFDRIAGTKPGEACARRDLPMELADALSKYNIDLCLYYTGDGPWKDDIAGSRFGFTEPRKDISMDFCKKWASVLEEYAERYGDKVKAWWIDGCYRESLGYTEEMYEQYYNVIVKANPQALVGFNDGVKRRHEKNYSKETLLCGEFNDFTQVPKSDDFYGGALPHTLAPLGYDGETMNEYSGWGSPGVKRPLDYMVKYIQAVNRVGGVVTIDIFVRADGSFDPEQEGFLRQVGSRL
jgi:hypothetical protein